MKPDSSTECWNKVGDVWCDLAQSNELRLHYLMPFTLERLGNVSEKRVLDLGCGEGGYARALAARNADMTAADCSSYCIRYSEEKAKEDGLSIEHYLRNSNDLYGIEDGSFDVVLCAMMLMDCEDLQGTLREAARVLKPGGTLFASVLHPCFNGQKVSSFWEGSTRKVLIEDYFEPEEWQQPIRKGTDATVIWRHRTLEEYVNAFITAGLSITALHEPVPGRELASQYPRIAWLQKIPMFLFWELEKR